MRLHWGSGEMAGGSMRYMRRGDALVAVLYVRWLFATCSLGASSLAIRSSGFSG